MARRNDRPGAGSFLASIGFHAAIGVAIWLSTVIAPDPVLYQSFAVELFSPPPSVEAAEMQLGTPDELVIETPVEAPPQPPAPDPKPAAEAPAPRPEPPRPTQPQRAATAPRPDPDSANRGRVSAGPGAVAGSPGGENINIRMEGLRRDFPEYYQQIVLQISRCFSRERTSGTTNTAVVSFSIMRDGSITEIRLASRSPNMNFNLQAMGAIECAGSPPPGAPAGSPRRIGPMPADMPYDRLPVQFTFSPQGPGPDQ
jgi:outer membrane biosynthesis protein TonB